MHIEGITPIFFEFLKIRNNVTLIFQCEYN